MANTSNTTNTSDKWYFSKEQLENTPSRKCGYDAHKELSYRQQAANFIQDMGQRLKVSQLCINTAIVYMHRFYVFHSFTHFPWYQMAAAALFLAAKVEEQPRKLEYVIRVANACRNPRDTNIDINSERYQTQSQDLVFNENVLLQTLGFDVAIDHPHTHVVRCCHLVRASKDLAQTSYFMASNSLHLTTMCIQYKPTVVACFCILVACKWSNWEIPLSNEKKEWYSYVDPTVTAELLQQLTEEFLAIFEACPSRLKEKIMAIAENVAHTPSTSINSPFDTDPKKVIREDGKDPLHRSHESKSGMDNDPHRHRSRPHDASTSSQQQRERDRNRERLSAQQKAMANSQQKVPTHGHQRPPIDPKLKSHSRPHSIGGYPVSGGRVEPRDILREARDSPFGLANKDYRDTSREHTKDLQAVRGGDNKDFQKRDYLLKSNVQTEMNNTNNYQDARLNYSDKQRIDPNKIRMDATKVSSSKHDPMRRQEELKPYIKSDAENIKKHLSAGIPDKTNTYINKPLISTSKKMKSPLDIDMLKSVPKHNLSQPIAVPKPHYTDSSNGSLFSPPSYNNNDVKPKAEHMSPKLDTISPKLETITPKIESIKEEIPTPAIIKRPSLFSPEKTPPHKKQIKSPSSIKKNESSLLPMSPLGSPGHSRRSRNYSSSSEPELRPVMKKIDQVEGFENLMRDNTIGINNTDQKDSVHAEMKHELVNDVPNITNNRNNTNGKPTLVNGLETNPTIISNLLKESQTFPHLPVVAAASDSSSNTTVAPPQTQSDVKAEKDHHHHKSKKKNKEKHKHKDKNRDDKEKKRKHKDKDREKHKHKEKHDAPSVTSTAFTAEPIKLKIQKDKIQLIPESSTASSSQGLKIKIPKEKIKTDSLNELSQSMLPPTGGLKLKIPKEKISNCNLSNLESGSNNSRKRERERASTPETPHVKVPKLVSKDSKMNGRYSHNKVAQMGDGDTTLHRLAESKYIHKSSSS